MTGVPIRRLVRLGIPVEALRYLIRQVAHAALPPLSALDERDVRVDVRSAATAAGDDGVGNHGDFGVSRFERSVGGENEGEREFRLLEEGVGRRNGVDRHALVGRVGIARRRLREGSLQRAKGSVSTAQGTNIGTHIGRKVDFGRLKGEQLERVERRLNQVQVGDVRLLPRSS